jgi:Chromo (CHRromatin Organisation MOdifier) domain
MPRYFGPFRIIEQVGNVAYRLELPAKLKVHPAFHVSMLKAYDSSERHQLPPSGYVLDGELHWNVERVLDHRWVYGRGKKPKRQFRVHWEGYSPEHDSWRRFGQLPTIFAEVP